MQVLAIGDWPKVIKAVIITKSHHDYDMEVDPGSSTEMMKPLDNVWWDALQDHLKFGSRWWSLNKVLSDWDDGVWTLDVRKIASWSCS